MATVIRMHEAGTWSPDVGYWAEEHDPTGRLHPLIYTASSDGRWIQATGVLLPWAGRVLYGPFGLAGLLVLPITGSVLAALASRSLGRGLGSDTGWPAFWAVGLGTPMLFYAGDFWEHSLAVGLAIAALALSIPFWSRLRTPGVRNRDEKLLRAASAGALLGLAAAMRAENLVFAAVLGVAMVVASRRIAAALTGFLAAAGVFAANLALESAVLPSSGATRVSGHLAEAGSGLTERVRDVALTTVGLYPDTTGRALLAGGVAAVGLVALGALATGRNGLVLRAAAAVGVTLVAVRLLQGPGFVPGLLPAAPLAAAAVGVRDRVSGTLAIASVLAVPIVAGFAWRGQLVAQWGGRLLLLSGVLLTVVGIVAVERAGWRRPPAVALGVATAAMAVTAAAWHAQRTSAYASALATIEDAPPETVIVSRIPHLGREAGASWDDHRWLRADDADALTAAAAVASTAGASHMRVVDDADAARTATALAGWRHEGTASVRLLDAVLVVDRYSRR